MVMRGDPKNDPKNYPTDYPNAVSLDFSGLIQAGDVVVCGQATAEPRSLTEALIAQAIRLKEIIGRTN
jgi:hypothetical protein